MASSVPVKNFLQQRRDRTVGSILGHLEGSGLKSKMSAAEWQTMRRVVIDATNSYHDSVLDLMKAEDGVVHNDALIDLLERVDQGLRRTPIQTPVETGR